MIYSVYTQELWDCQILMKVFGGWDLGTTWNYAMKSLVYHVENILLGTQIQKNKNK